MWTFAQQTLIAASLTVVVAANGGLIPYSYEAALEAHRNLQDSQSSSCGGTIGDLISCYAEKCADEPCDIEPGVTPEPPAGGALSGCDVLEDAFCSSFDVSSECCPPCSAQTQTYVDCIVENSFLQLFCADASCAGYFESGNLTIPDGNMTKPNTTTSDYMEEPDSMPEIEDTTGEEIPDDMGSDTDTIDVETGGEVDTGSEQSTDDWLAGFCANEIAVVFGCYLTECGGRDCEDTFDEADPEGEDEGVDDCDDFTEAFCGVIDDADECCPECAEATAAYQTCALREQVSLLCPDASCSDGDGDDEDTVTSASKTGTETSRAIDEGEHATSEAPPSNQQQASPSKPMLPIAEAAELESSGVSHFASKALMVLGLLSLALQ